MIESTLRTYYLDDPAISALIGARFHWGSAPQNTPTPYIRASLVSDTTSHLLNGQTTGLYQRLVQFSIFADSFEKATTIRDAIIARSADYEVSSAPPITIIRHELTRSLVEEVRNIALHHIAVDLTVHFTR